MAADGFGWRMLRRLAFLAATLGAEMPEEAALDRVVRELTTTLEKLDPLERSEAVAEWATDDREGVRLALALALPVLVPAVSAPLALEHLARDPSPRVRAAAATARSWLKQG